MKDNGKIIKKKDLEKKYLQAVIFILGNIKKIKLTAKEEFYFMMDNYM
jgi:hypothetical protein